MALLFGEIETKVDAKHRLAIGLAFRELLHPEQDGRDFIMILGPDRHLWLYPELYYRRLLRTMRRSPLPTRDSAHFNLFFGMAALVRPDAQGRVVIPPKLLSRANTSESVTVVGNDDHLEIWPTDEWERHVEEGLKTYGEMLFQAAERMNAESATE